MLNLTENSTTILNSVEFDKDNYIEWLAPKVFPFITFPVTVIFGFPFNILSILTIIKSSLWQTTLFRYMAFVSISDLLVIIGYTSRGFAYLLIEYINELTYTILNCQIFVYLFITFGQISSLCIIAVTLDRYLCIIHPTKAKVWSTLGICNRIIFSICIYAIAVDFFILIVQDKSTRFSSTRVECTPKTKGGVFFYKYFLSFHNFIYAFVPSISLGILNILIVRGLKRHVTETDNVTNTETDRKMKATTRKLTVLNILISSSFILLTLPFASFNIYIRFGSKNFNTNVYEKLIFEFFFTFNSINHMINFLFYCICGKTFRKEMMKLFVKSSKKNEAKRSTFSSESF